MEFFSLECATEWVQGTMNGQDALIKSVSTNSRDIGEDCLFIPLVGEKFDGHDFIESAIANGAVAVLTQRDERYSVPSIKVQDTVKALASIAKGYRQERMSMVVGITGSVGKTTTKEIVASVLSKRFNTHKTQGNFNNEIGMPQTILGMSDLHEMTVLEMGMNHFGEIERLTKCAQPNFAIITNIGTSHIEFLGSREGICTAKLEILQGLSIGGVAILNGDEPLLWDKAGEFDCKTIYYGIENENCDIIAKNIEYNNGNTMFTVQNNKLYGAKAVRAGDSFKACLNVLGKHNVYNALAASAVALICGMNSEEIASGLNEFKPDGMRQNVYENNGYTIFADCYNASPDSMEATLEALSIMECTGERIAVLGGMLELGEYAETGHKRAGIAAAKYADKLYLYGENAEHTKAGAISHGMSENNICIAQSHEQLAELLKENAKCGDALLFKGSRGMKMERVLELFLGEKENG